MQNKKKPFHQHFLNKRATLTPQRLYIFRSAFPVASFIQGILEALKNIDLRSQASSFDKVGPIDFISQDAGTVSFCRYEYPAE